MTLRFANSLYLKTQSKTLLATSTFTNISEQVEPTHHSFECFDRPNNWQFRNVSSAKRSCSALCVNAKISDIVMKPKQSPVYTLDQTFK